MEFIIQAFRQIVFILDQVTYGLIPPAYELLFYLSNINLSSEPVFKELVSRIYLLLGIFMLFKVSFSIMQYIVDPNAFSDKSKGFGKLVTNALVAVVLLAMIPFIFDKAYEYQNKIILSNVIPNLILGQHLPDYNQGVNEKSLEDSRKDIHTMAVDVQFTMFSAFYNLNTDAIGGFTSCDPSKTGKATSNVIGSADMIKSGDSCWGEVEPLLTEELHNQGGKLKSIFQYCEKEDCSGADDPIDERRFSSLAYLLWWAKDGGADFTISYIPIISALVGGYLLLLLVTFAIDIAARVFKLLFLQAVAPIAIVSYIDPKESASNGKLHNWASETLKTYVSLFLRLAVIYLAIQLIKLLTSVLWTPLTTTGDSAIYANNIAPEGTMNMFVYVFLILGIFTFAKKVPQMIENIFGLKMSGEMHLNPFKAIGENAGATALIGGAAGLVAGGAAAAMQRKQLGGGNIRSAFSGIGGAITGAFGGAKNGFTSGGKGYLGAGLKQGGRTAWNMYDRHSTTFGSRMLAGFQNTTGAPMSSHMDKQRAETYKTTMEGVKKIKENAKIWGAQNDTQYMDAYAQVERLKAQGTTSGASWMAAQKNLAAAEDKLYESYVNNGHMGAEDQAILNQINYTNKENKGYAGYTGKDVHTWDEINNLNKSVKAANNELAYSNKTQDHAHAEESAKRQAQRGWRARQ